MQRDHICCCLLNEQGIKKAQTSTVIIEMITVRRKTAVRTKDTKNDVDLNCGSSPLSAVNSSCLLSTSCCWICFGIPLTSESSSFVSWVPFPFQVPFWMLITRSSSLSSLSAWVRGSYFRGSCNFFPVRRPKNIQHQLWQHCASSASQTIFLRIQSLNTVNKCQRFLVKFLFMGMGTTNT